MSTISCYPAISKWASLRLQSLFWQINPTRRQFIPPLCDLYVRFVSDATFAVLCQFCFLVGKYNFCRQQNYDRREKIHPLPDKSALPNWNLMPIKESVIGSGAIKGRTDQHPRVDTLPRRAWQLQDSFKVDNAERWILQRKKWRCVTQSATSPVLQTWRQGRESGSFCENVALVHQHRLHKSGPTTLRFFIIAFNDKDQCITQESVSPPILPDLKIKKAPPRHKHPARPKILQKAFTMGVVIRSGRGGIGRGGNKIHGPRTLAA